MIDLGERRALERIGARSDLVEQDERHGGRGLEDRDEVSHVPREGREAHRDRLLVADVGEHPVEDGQLDVVGGQAQAALVERRDETERLQRDGLAARVRPADHDGARLAEVEVDRHRDVGVEQGMPRAAQDGRVGRRRRRALPPTGQPSARQREVSLSDRPDECGQLRRVLPDCARQAPSVRPPRVPRSPPRGASFDSSTRAKGSTKSVCPEAELSWTIPRHGPARRRAETDTGRPARSVTKSSWRCSRSPGSRASPRSHSAIRPRPSRSSRAASGARATRRPAGRPRRPRPPSRSPRRRPRPGVDLARDQLQAWSPGPVEGGARGGPAPMVAAIAPRACVSRTRPRDASSVSGRTSRAAAL